MTDTTIIKAVVAGPQGPQGPAGNLSLPVTQGVVVVAAGGAPVEILAAKTGRRYLAIVNVGLGRATLGFGAAAAVGQGWPLEPAGELGGQGGGYIAEAGGVPNNALFAASTQGTTLIVLEG